MTLPTAVSLDSHNCTTNPATKETAHCQPIYWQLTSGQKSKKGHFIRIQWQIYGRNTH